MKWNLEAAADQLGEISLLNDAPRDWLLAEARAVVEAAFTCLHDDAGEGDWCYSCWTNVKTGETFGEFRARDVGPMG